jgi:hypothetical protein
MSRDPVSVKVRGRRNWGSPPREPQRFAPVPRLVEWPDEPEELRDPPLELGARLGDGELERDRPDELGARTLGDGELERDRPDELGALRELAPGLTVPLRGDALGGTIRRLGRSGEVLGTITGRDPVTGLEGRLLPRVDGITERLVGELVPVDGGLVRRRVGGTTSVLPLFSRVPGEVVTVPRFEGATVDTVGRAPPHPPSFGAAAPSVSVVERWMFGRVWRPVSTGAVPVGAVAVRDPARAPLDIGDRELLGMGAVLEARRLGVVGSTSCRARVGSRSPSRARTGVRSVETPRSTRSKARSSEARGAWRLGASVTRGLELTTASVTPTLRRATSPGFTRRERLGLAKSSLRTTFQAVGSMRPRFAVPLKSRATRLGPTG